MSTLATPPSVLPRPRRGGPRHPEYGALLGCVAAWLLLVVHTVAMGGHGSHRSGPAEPGGLDGAPAGLPGLPVWTVMCVAMMVPVVLPAIRHVGENSLRWRRRRAIGWFLAGYLGVWVGFGALVLPAVAALGGRVAGHLLLAGALALAAVWQVQPYRWWFRHACHLTVPLPPRGWPATKADVHFGLHQGVACVGMCWPLMLAMATAPQHSLLWMVALTVAVVGTRMLPATDRIARPVAVVLAGTALAVLLGG